MAVLGIGAIAAVLVGLQCGGLDQCFVGKAPVAAATSPVAAEASLSPVIATPAEAVAPAASAVAMSQAPQVPEGVQRAQRVDRMIGNTFVALASDDEGWLRGAVAVAVAANDPETYAEGDGAGPPAPVDETAVEAADAVAGDTLERPTPLDVTAFAEAPAVTAANVKAAAEKQLAEVAKAQPAPVAEPEPEPEPAPAPEPAAKPEPKPEPKSEPKSEPKPEPKQQASTSGDTRTVAGAGVNVRSGPGKSNGRAFGLAGGQKVTVTENQRGWLKITDGQGRTGWVYKDYLN